MLLCLLAAAAAAFAFSAPLQAQDEYVDLLMLHEQSPEGSGNAKKVAYTVRNSGTATATGVTVEFLLEDLQANDIDMPSITGKETVDTTNQRFTWEIGTILPGQSSTRLVFSTSLHPGRFSEVVGGWRGRIGIINATASALQLEPGILSANNATKVYSYATNTTGATPHMRGNRLALFLSVDDLKPAAGADLNLDLTARNHNGGQAAASAFLNLIDDIEIKVELSRGLKFRTGWNPSGVTVASDRQSATWKPEAVDTRGDFGNQVRPNLRELEIQTQLTSDTLTDIPLEERCITARVAKSTPPPTPITAWAASSNAWATTRRCCLRKAR